MTRQNTWASGKAHTFAIRFSRNCAEALCGRILDNAHVDEENPRYKFPPKREYNGVVYETHKTELVYNAHRLMKPIDDLIIVEGFPSVWWLTQMGFPNAVGLMGWSMSEAQAKIVMKLVPKSGHLWIISDGDEAGDRCAHSIYERLGCERFLRWLKLDEGKQPTDYPGGWYRTRLEK